jgi:hypothetical protein
MVVIDATSNSLPAMVRAAVVVGGGSPQTSGDHRASLTSQNPNPITAVCPYQLSKPGDGPIRCQVGGGTPGRPLPSGERGMEARFDPPPLPVLSPWTFRPLRLERSQGVLS